MDAIDYYQDRGHFQGIIDLLEHALTVDKAHMAMFTELWVLRTKYQSKQMIDNRKMCWQHCNILRLVRACDAAMLYAEIVYVPTKYNEFDNVALVVIEPYPAARTQSRFITVIAKASIVEVMYKAIQLYIAKESVLLGDLLSVLSPKV